MDTVNVRFPPKEIDRVDQIVAESTHFENRSSYIRYAVRESLQREDSV